MQHYKLTIAYDGTDYKGWQQQPHQQAIENILINTYVDVFGKQPPYFIGASRTDAGVHALGQVALLKTDLTISPDDLYRAWANRLPSGIMIRSLEPVDESFHPQLNVKQKTYWYHLFQERPLPFVARYGWYYFYPIDFDKLQACLQLFVGTHDFRSFTAAWERENTVRTIDAMGVIYCKRYKVYRIEIKGERFLYNMIRRMVGAAVKIASVPSIAPTMLLDILAEKNSEQTLPKAPPQGLLLYKIQYKELL